MLIFSGLLRKCVVADNCALLANAAFAGQFGKPNLWIVLLGSYAFAWQVYGDFSGYSDIARGSAQLMGFHFMVNFRQPYLSLSLREFWRRWHISLSSWLHKYLYVPLGGSAGGEWKTALNLMTTMVLAGLWHGANWTFVIFGALHGVALSVEHYFWPNATRSTGPARSSGFAAFLSRWGRRILTFHLLCFTVAVFRAPSLRFALQFFAGLSDLSWRSEYATAFAMLALFAIPLFVVDLLVEASDQEYLFANAPYAWRTALAVASVFVLAIFSGNNLNAFIYFRF
jgi:D-alanyl-lipoteichoic acid acyltransferase DltB (MBOAT superfamily)